MRTLLRSCLLVAAALATTAAPSLAQFVETEANDTKATANPCSPMITGSTITGTSISSTGTGLDYFLVTTAPSALGIYRHQLVLTTTGTAGHIGNIRGLNQSAGVIGVTDTTVQASSTATTPARMNQWYGFGKAESLYYRVNGAAATTLPYTATLTTTPVTPIAITTCLVAGSITINTGGNGHTTDTDIWLYDSALNAIAGAGNDDEFSTTNVTSRLTRTLAAGTYYVAVTNFNLANNLASPADDDFRGGAVMDFANSAANSSTSTALNVAFSITDGTNSVVTAATRSAAYDVVWATFTLSATPCPPSNDNCAGALNAVCGGGVTGNTTLATLDTPPACGPAPTAAGVWYKVNGTGFNITATTCDAATTYDTRLSVYSGTCGSLTCVVDNDDDGSCANPLSSTVVFATSPGTTYYILVHGKGVTDVGTFRLNLTCPNYCSSTSTDTSTSNERIARVQLGSIDNTPAGTAQNNYTFYPLSTTVGRTNGYPITVTIANPFSTDRCTVYADWNQNLVLNDPGEVLLLNGGAGPSGVTFSGTLTPPGSATLGTTRMRVAMGDTGAGSPVFSPTNPCLTFTFGEVEDYLLNVVDAPPANDVCSGALNAVCGGSVSGSTTLALVDAPPTCGPAPVANGVWFKVPGTGFNITATTCDPGTNYDTRLTVYSGTCASLVCETYNDDDGSCTPGMRSTVSWSSLLGTDYFILVHGKTASDNGLFTLNLNCPNYCASTSTDSTPSFEYITRVQIDGVDNSPGGTGQDHYTNYVPIEIVSLNLCSVQPITVTIANPFSSDRCTVYFDWNQNLVLNDPGEMFQLNGGAGPTGTTFTGNITVPPGASLGSSRMRVAMGDTGSGVLFNPTNPCGTFQYGEVEDYGLSVLPALDSDGDGSNDCIDGCPADPLKTSPGVCGCGTPDTDSDSDGTPDCNDGCPADPLKTSPGVCGCGTADTDSDSDGTPDCNDGCPADPLKTSPGVCGCGTADTDSDSDGTPDCNDGCPADPLKTSPGICGCGTADTDSDSDGTADCNDGCPADPLKTSPGQCGCGTADTDTDSDGTADCNDGCDTDPLKTTPGVCGCGVADVDTDGDGVFECVDNCPGISNPGQADGDTDGVGDDCDNCPTDPNPGQADCDNNGEGDVCAIAGGAPDCNNNGIPDSCDIAGGGSADSNSNGVPDECEAGMFAPFCFPDVGGIRSCPCNNPQVPALSAKGCDNYINASTVSGTGGAALTGTGFANASVANTLVFHIAGAHNPNSNSNLHVFWMGSTSMSPGVKNGFGVRCVAGVARIYIGLGTGSGGLGSTNAIDFPNVNQTTDAWTASGMPPAGTTLYYYDSFRDQQGPANCDTTADRFNLSNAGSVLWAP